MRTTILVLMAVGCDNPNYPPPLPLEARLMECNVTSDCALVELGCCDACNGGVAVVVNNASVGEVEAEYSERCRAGWGCSLRGCPPFEVFCEAGQCGMNRAATF